MASLASPLVQISQTPESDKRFWSNLHERVESLLETRKSDIPTSSNSSPLTSDNNAASKKLKADSLLLMRGFDSIATSLFHLTANIETALQGARELGTPSAVTEITHSSCNDTTETVDDDNVEEKLVKDEERKGVKRKLEAQDCSNSTEEDSDSDNKKKHKHQTDMNHLNKVKNLAVAMAAKSASVARELKSVKSDMSFLQERCALLEEENQRLRDGFGKGVRPDDDDLVRLQFEALLAEKSRLATENANLTRENQCLRQLVEYHQFASEDLSASYEQALIQGLCLDFSSPKAECADNLQDPQTPTTPRENFEFGEQELLKD
ncbi:uncharacterized protein LOC104900010 [Beta vulgaris subsp. vulgaris]|uniref:uncharacterized protein LOC104900010 n=1 Tax=Beta vulgaris subsp. vulgaris TaxID=3555 RepID=UPI0020371BAA|nr:uncharacterized protein LOC104900010 [Beta vulgaris subsp. vulgaris]